MTPRSAKKYGFTTNKNPNRSTGRYGSVNTFSFLSQGKARKYGRVKKADKTGSTEGTKYGRFNTFSFYTPGKVKKYGGVTPIQTKVTRKQLHPSASYMRGNAKSSSESKDKTFKFGIWWASLFKRNDSQPQNLKSKEKKPRYDKRETDLWNY